MPQMPPPWLRACVHMLVLNTTVPLKCKSLQSFLLLN